LTPFIVLVTGFVVLRGLGTVGFEALDSWQPALRGGLALMFTLTATAHVTRTRRSDLIAMVPPRQPRPDLLVTATGILELLGAVGLLVPATARLAAGCLAALLVAMFQPCKRYVTGPLPRPRPLPCPSPMSGASQPVGHGDAEQT
jgi:uncharacterized membrane protein